MPGMQWARLQANLNIRLRRGAWYRIRQAGPLQVVLEVRGQPVQVPAAFLQIIETPLDRRGAPGRCRAAAVELGRPLRRVSQLPRAPAI